MKRLMMSAALGLLAAAGICATAQAAPAPSQSPMPWQATAGHMLLQPAYHPASRCGAWRRECAARWGWGTWRFHRCMGRHWC